DVQAYTARLARVYRDWAAPKPSRKGRFVTRVDFDVYTGGRPASGFEITQPSGEQAQDRSAYGEAVRKSRELPPPPACVGDKLRVYHQFIVEYF
ncbi:MAG: TonB C-terminal domain-containing protein, partial [Prochlorococcaceae cyanobacterium]